MLKPVHPVAQPYARGIFTLSLFILVIFCAVPLRAQDNRNKALLSKGLELFNEGARLVKEGSKESLREALAKYGEAQRLYHLTGDRHRESTTLLRMGTIYHSLGDEQKALEQFETALPLIRSLRDTAAEASTLNDIGNVYGVQGEPEKAIDYYSKALELFRQAGIPKSQARPIRDMGAAYSSMGEKGKALDYFSKAFVIYKAAHDAKGEARTLNDLGNVYRWLGQRQKAVDFFEQSLSLSREAGARNIEAAALTDLGDLNSSLGNKEKAVDCYALSLPLFRAVGDRRGEARTLIDLGELYTSLGDSKKALDNFQQALSITRAVGNRAGEARTLTNIAIMYDSIGDGRKALENFTHGLAIYHEIQDLPGQSRSLFFTALAERGLGRLEDAVQHVEAALAIVESLRVKIDNEEFRSSYFANMQGYYRFYVGLLMQLHKLHPAEGYDARALQATERAHARTLLDTLTESQADIREGVSPALLKRERSLQQDINTAARKRMQALNAENSQEQSAADASAGASKIEALTLQLQQVEAQIRQTSPRYAALTQPQPLTSREIQTRLLDRDTLLLSYFLGQEHSYLWAVTPDSITSYELPKASVVEGAAREVYSLLSAPGKWSPSARALGIPTNDRAVSQPVSVPAAPEAAARLSQMILAPVAGQLGNKRLLIVADGALQYLPFAALPVPSNQAAKNAVYRPLISEHEVVSLPSASTLVALRDETEGRKPPSKVLAVLADPVFNLDDERLAGVGGNLNGHSTPPVKPTVNNVTSEGGGLKLGMDGTVPPRPGTGGTAMYIPRLPGTRKEATQILALADGRQTRAAMDFDASRTTATSPDLGDYQYVHFATHGFLDSEHPELSGIVLSMYDRNGRPQDGFFRANQVFNLKLSASVVTLSACETGLGKEIRGEGLVGLTRAFMYAGAPRVVVSLWSVNDASTAELMTRFYQGMLKGNLRPAQALQAAQLSMLKDQRFSSPYYWAAFILQGEWR
jgi:CHAT domain-containing protein/tetratricopeptide (TPR) repeat protein